MARATTAGNISKDSYHAAILSALDEQLDDQAFEACACDLLHQIYPNLVPIRGGSDDGYDGVVYSDSGPPIPLISTTGTDATGNLSRNLKKACARELKPVLAVFATTRPITPRRRRNLETAALEIAGVALRVYEREWFANTLYRNGAWAKKLLGVTGQPSALSTSPLSSRPLLGGQLIGRDDELKRLRGITSDVLVIAEPGAGKTFLLSELARKRRALFLADSTPEALADAIRSQQPAAIILDDAHIRPETLTKLRHLRKEVGAKFHIIAVGWPGEASSLQTLLGVTSNDVITLPGIDADTMVKIIQSVGIHGPRDLVHSIVRQAEGRAGLATTLADLCLRGDHREVWSGQSLTRDLLHMLKQLVGEDPAPLLACFSLAGATGFKSEVVARFLGKPLDQISSLLARLGSAGVIRTNERSDGVSVWPDLLRWNLVRDVFFAGAGRLSPDELLNQSPNIDQTVLTLVGAKSRGAPIPYLEQWLERSQSADIWGAYASLGKSEAQHVIQSRPVLIVELSWALLTARPAETIPFLLDAAVGDERQLHANPGHPLRRLESWIEYPANRVQSRVWRTTTLLAAIERWWKTKGMNTVRFGNVAIHAFAIAFKPNWLFTKTDPRATP